MCVCVVVCDFGQFLNFANVSGGSISAGTFGGHCSWSGILAADTFVSVSFYLYLWHVYKANSNSQSNSDDDVYMCFACCCCCCCILYTTSWRFMYSPSSSSSWLMLCVVLGLRSLSSDRLHVCNALHYLPAGLPACLGAGASTSSSELRATWHRISSDEPCRLPIRPYAF